MHLRILLALVVGAFVCSSCFVTSTVSNAPAPDKRSSAIARSDSRSRVSQTPESRFPAPPDALRGEVIWIGNGPISADEKWVDQFIKIELKNGTGQAYDAMEFEVRTNSVGPEHKQRISVENRFGDALGVHVGSLLPGQRAAQLILKAQIPIEHYRYGRKIVVESIGARPVTKPLDLKIADSVWIFMRGATPAELGRAMSENPGLRQWRGTYGVTPTLMASARPDVAALEAVLKAGGSLADRTRRKLTPLHCAAAGGSKETIRRIVDGGVSPKEITQNGQTPLHAAVLHHNLDAAEALIAAGVDLDKQDAGGSTALAQTPEGGSTKMAELLMKSGADLRKANKQGGNYMNAAAALSQVPFLKLGVKQGLKLNEAEPLTGLTPLHFAAQYGATEAVAWLLDNGADRNARNVAGQTPLELMFARDTHPVNRRMMKAVFAAHGKP